MILSSVAEPEPHHFGGAGAGATTTPIALAPNLDIKRFLKCHKLQFLIPV
jgi:hypothetical protein